MKREKLSCDVLIALMLHCLLMLLVGYGSRMSSQPPVMRARFLGARGGGMVGAGVMRIRAVGYPAGTSGSGRQHNVVRGGVSATKTGAVSGNLPAMGAAARTGLSAKLPAKPIPAMQAGSKTSGGSSSGSSGKIAKNPPIQAQKNHLNAHLARYADPAASKTSKSAGKIDVQSIAKTNAKSGAKVSAEAKKPKVSNKQEAQGASLAEATMRPATQEANHKNNEAGVSDAASLRATGAVGLTGAGSNFAGADELSAASSVGGYGAGYGGGYGFGDGLGEEAGLISVVAGYQQEIMRAISYFWERPEGLSAREYCCYIAELSPDGRIAKLQLEQNSGNYRLNNSAKAAIQAAEPLPLPEDEESYQKFKYLRLIFRGNGSLGGAN